MTQKSHNPHWGRQIALAPIAFIRYIWVSIVLALGQIASAKTRSLLATLGIVIGIASVAAVIGALTGLRAKVLNEFETFGANKLFIFARHPSDGPKKNADWRLIRFQPQDVNGLLENAPALAAMTRMAETRINVTYQDQIVENVAIKGIDPDWHQIEQRFVIKDTGRPFSVVDSLNAQPVCLITENLRDELRLPQDPYGQAVHFLNRRMTIIGVVEPPANTGGMFGGGGGLQHEVFVPFQTLHRAIDTNLYVIANAQSPQLADEARAQARFYLRQSKNLSPDEPDTFGIQVMQQFIDQFKNLAAGVTAVAGGIVGVSLLVGGVGIMNIMLVSVSERTREIGLRKAVGARPSAILLQFLIESVVLCSIGGLLGIACGQGLITLIKHIPNAQLDQAAIPVWAIVLSLGFSALVGISFGLFPAIKAARLNPIDALRHE